MSPVDYAAKASRALKTITRKGATVTFLANDHQGGSITTSTPAKAVAIEGDADQYVALGLVKRNPVTLIVAGSGLSISLAQSAPIAFTWGGVTYGLEQAEPIAPDGATVIVWTVVGATA
jgi:hypothetical protein